MNHAAVKTAAAALVTLGGMLVAASSAAAQPLDRGREVIVGPATDATARICYRVHKQRSSSWEDTKCNGDDATGKPTQRVNALEIWATGAGRLCLEPQDHPGRPDCAAPGDTVRLGDPNKKNGAVFGGFTLSVEKARICGSVKFRNFHWSPEKCGKRIELGRPQSTVQGVRLHLIKGDG